MTKLSLTSILYHGLSLPLHAVKRICQNTLLFISLNPMLRRYHGNDSVIFGLIVFCSRILASLQQTAAFVFSHISRKQSSLESRLLVGQQTIVVYVCLFVSLFNKQNKHLFSIKLYSFLPTWQRIQKCSRIIEVKQSIHEVI